MITIIARCIEDTTIDGITIFGGGLITRLSEENWDKIYSRYKGYFDTKIQNDKNPQGIFIINDNRQYAVDQHKEVGNIEIDRDKKIEEIVDKTIEEVAPQLVEAHKENKKAKKKK